MRLKLNTALNGFPAGAEIGIETREGVPVDRFWRDRIRDAEIDKCVEIVKKKPVERKK